jgi:hypothetical protein
VSIDVAKNAPAIACAWADIGRTLAVDAQAMDTQELFYSAQHRSAAQLKFVSNRHLLWPPHSAACTWCFSNS